MTSSQTKPRPGVVLDTNVIVSGLIFPVSAPGRVLTYVMAEMTLLQSVLTLDELADVLRRPKFDRWISKESRAQAFSAISRSSRMIEAPQAITLCRDEKDNRLLDLARAGEARYIVSGDEDLLALVIAFDVPIVSPAEFLNQVQLTD